MAGDTLFNVLKMAEMETDANERPLIPPRILRTEVIANPFSDIVVREKQETKVEEQSVDEGEAQSSGPKKKYVLGV